MKIRHKQSGVELEGEFSEQASGSLTRIVDRYFVEHGTSSRYDMQNWEPVSEWVDVTGECEWEHGVLTYRGNPLSSHYGYRLRKVGVEWFSGVPLGLAKCGHAFIIEQRQS